MAIYEAALTALALAAATADARQLVGNRLVLPSDPVDDAAARRLEEPIVDADEEDTYEEGDGDDPDEDPPLGDLLDHGSLLDAQFSADPHKGRDRMEMIKSGELGLSDIIYGPTSFLEDGTDIYKEVYGEFCEFDATVVQDDPTEYPTIMDVMGESVDCSERRFTVPLEWVIDAVDEPAEGVKTLPLSGMLFHQGHAGAGLIANALSVVDADLVVEHHIAVHSALSACDEVRNRYDVHDCSTAKRDKLVRDVISLLQRTGSEDVERLYLKLESASAAYISTLVRMYPETPWTFSFRDAEEALAKATDGHRAVTCTRLIRSPSSALLEKAAENNLDLEQLSQEELCALQLVVLLEAAANEHESSGTGMLVDYQEIVETDVVVDAILPYLGVEVNDQIRKAVEEVLALKSNTRTSGEEDKVYEGEEVEVSEEVKEAAQTFMGDVLSEARRLKESA